jgi:pantetheine-phosphate adenylyltransferase
MIAIYPGTFDPATNGHLDLIRRARSIFPRLIVAVAAESDMKNTLFSLEERVEMLTNATQNFAIDAEIKPFDGLLVDFVKLNGANVVVRGIRAMSDFEYEFQMASINQRLDENIQTIFLPARDDMHFISSRFIKNIAKISGDVSKFVPANIELKLRHKYKNT